MEIPFNIEKHAEEQLNYEVQRFIDLYRLFGNNVEEALEFAELYKKLVYKKNNTWV